MYTVQVSGVCSAGHTHSNIRGVYETAKDEDDCGILIAFANPGQKQFIASLKRRGFRAVATYSMHHGHRCTLYVKNRLPARKSRSR